MTSARLQAAFLLLAAAAAEDVRKHEAADFKPVGRGRIVGRDNGNGGRAEQSRNAACACGSGRKFKHCCRRRPHVVPDGGC